MALSCNAGCGLHTGAAHGNACLRAPTDGNAVRCNAMPPELRPSREARFRLHAAEQPIGCPLARTIRCAVTRRYSSAGANPARQLSLQPVAVGADDGGNDIG